MVIDFSVPDAISIGIWNKAVVVIQNAEKSDNIFGDPGVTFVDQLDSYCLHCCLRYHPGILIGNPNCGAWFVSLEVAIVNQFTE